MKAQELREKTLEDLQKELIALRREQFNLRMQLGMGQAARPHQFSKIRKDIARIKTIMNEKRRAQ